MKTQTKERARQSAKWMAGMAAATGVGQAATVQIDLINNQIGNPAVGGTTSFNADLTGGGEIRAYNARGAVDDFRLLEARAYSYGAPIGMRSFSATAGLYATGSLAQRVAGANAFYSSDPNLRYNAVFLRDGNPPSPRDEGIAFTPQDATRLVPVLIADSDINGGAATNGFLEVRAYHVDATEMYVVLNRLVFDDASTMAPTDAMPGKPETRIGSVEDGVFTPVPEPSGLALLALGAAGVVTRRQRKKVA